MNGWTKFALGINMAGVAFNAAVGAWPWMAVQPRLHRIPARDGAR